MDTIKENYEEMLKVANKDESSGITQVSLNIHKDFMKDKWGFEEGMREIGQNFFDRLRSQRELLRNKDCSYDPDEALYRVDNLGNGQTLVMFYGKDSNGIKIPLGHIYQAKFFSDPDVIEFTNYWTALSYSILVIGSTSKSGSKTSSGGFGEGLKVGINAIMRCSRPKVTYETGKLEWEFFHKNNEHDQSVLTVSFKPRIARPHETYGICMDWSTHTTVRVSVHSIDTLKTLGNLFLDCNRELQQDLSKVKMRTLSKFPRLWYKTHFFFDPNLEVNSDLLNTQKESLLGKLYCRGIYVDFSNDLFLFGVGFNCASNLIMNRDRKEVNVHELEKIFAWKMPKYLHERDDLAQNRYVYQLIAATPVAGSNTVTLRSPSGIFGSTEKAFEASHRTIWGSLNTHTPLNTHHIKWLANKLYEIFCNLHGKDAIPCLDKVSRYCYEHYGLGYGVVMSETLVKLLLAMEVVYPPRIMLEKRINTSPISDLSNKAEVILLGNRIIYAILAGNESFDDLRDDKEKPRLIFHDTDLPPDIGVVDFITTNQSNDKRAELRAHVPINADFQWYAENAMLRTNAPRDKTKKNYSKAIFSGLMVYANQLRAVFMDVKKPEIVELHKDTYYYQTLFTVMMIDIENGFLRKANEYHDELKSVGIRRKVPWGEKEPDHSDFSPGGKATSSGSKGKSNGKSQDSGSKSTSEYLFHKNLPDSFTDKENADDKSKLHHTCPVETKMLKKSKVRLDSDDLSKSFTIYDLEGLPFNVPPTDYHQKLHIIKVLMSSVFDQPDFCCGIYCNPLSNVAAFNRANTIFFNLGGFSADRNRIFVIICHEMAHIKYKCHSVEFTMQEESIIEKYLSKYADNSFNP